MARLTHSEALHGEYPDPYILFQSVRSESGVLLDFEWTAFNPAAEPWVPGPSRALSAWQGVAGLPEPEVLGSVVEGGAPLGFELHVRRGGEERWFQARAVKQGDGFALWLSDRTEAHERERVLREALERAHEALEQERKAREREAYLSLALETAHMVTWEWSEARGSFSLSANAEDFFGAPPEGLGNTVEWLLGRAQPEERVRIAEAFARMRSTAGAHAFQFQGPWPDGTVHTYEVVGQSFHEEGLPLRVLGVAMDITARLRSQEAVRAAEERYRLAALATNDVLWEWLPSTGHLYWSEACHRMFGYHPEEMGDVTWWAEQVHPLDRERVVGSLHRLVAEGGESWTAEYRFRSKDGTYVDVLDRGRAARDARGGVERMIGSIMDITERKRALERMAEEARFRERFIGILGHDLRSPLHAIALSARELGRRGVPVLHQRLLQRIETSAARMGNMISDILDLTRARLAGRIPLHLSVTGLPQVCQQVVEEMMAVHPERTLLLDIEGACEGVWDFERLAQVVSNLVGNALEHTPLDTPVRVRCREEGAGWRVLEISNRGTPIPSHLLDTLFDPFRQAGPARTGRGSGLGLGLYIVQQLVLAHQGTVSVRSTAEDGTTFTVRLPRDSQDAPAAAPEAPQGMGAPEFQPRSQECPTE
ncbi:PAS domain-containing protein [Cystobacter fuscus]|uniref:sensor histidine kinase n=1 Tax=Cystobacter fuscus TaxID=43 RepID=UPI0037BEDC84